MLKIRSRKNILVSATVIFLLFMGMSFLVHRNLFSNFDFTQTVKLQNHIPARFDLFRCREIHVAAAPN